MNKEQRAEYMKEYHSRTKVIKRVKRNRKKWINQEGIKEQISSTQKKKNEIKTILYDEYLKGNINLPRFVNKSLDNLKGN